MSEHLTQAIGLNRQITNIYNNYNILSIWLITCSHITLVSKKLFSAVFDKNNFVNALIQCIRVRYVYVKALYSQLSPTYVSSIKKETNHVTRYVFEL